MEFILYYVCRERVAEDGCYQWMIPGVGVEHELLVELATESFAKKPIWMEDSTLLQKPVERDLSLAQYTGGKVEVLASFLTVSHLCLTW